MSRAKNFSCPPRDSGLAKKTSNTIAVSPGSTDKVLDEYDVDFLAQTNDDMGVILTFAGLLSAVNSSFIGSMLTSEHALGLLGGSSHFIRDAFMAGQDAYRQMTQDDDDNTSHQANWSHSNGDKPYVEEFDWLIGYLANEAGGDCKSEGDALLALSATHGLSSLPSNRRLSMRSSVVWTKTATTTKTNINPPESDDSMPQGINANLLDSLCHTLFAAPRLLLGKEWEVASMSNPSPGRAGFRNLILLKPAFQDSIIGSINPTCKNITLTSTEKMSLGLLINKTWHAHIYTDDDDYVDAIPVCTES
ncbi:hypothetical protein BDR06DRAFT_1012787 [Suillus hirtellus]|nr:hypothetical protein BDR06DRAFT_1012787 [Suillus hirtellus]